MTILIIMALIVLLVVFAVFFLFFKVAWLIFSKNTNRGPLIAAGVCTALLTVLVGVGIYQGYRAVVAPFRGVIARVQANPAPIYGEHSYEDDTYPFKLTVYDGMDFSNWINLAGIQLKIGIDTNAFKKGSTEQTNNEPLLAVIVRQANVSSKYPLEDLQKKLAEIEDQRQLELTSAQVTQINGLPAYQAVGEAYTNRGKIHFWLTAVQAQPDTLYYMGAFDIQGSQTWAEQAQTMINSFSLVQP